MSYRRYNRSNIREEAVKYVTFELLTEVPNIMMLSDYVHKLIPRHTELSINDTIPTLMYEALDSITVNDILSDDRDNITIHFSLVYYIVALTYSNMCMEALYNEGVKVPDMSIFTDVHNDSYISFNFTMESADLKHFARTSYQSRFDYQRSRYLRLFELVSDIEHGEPSAPPNAPPTTPLPCIPSTPPPTPSKAPSRNESKAKPKKPVVRTESVNLEDYLKRIVDDIMSGNKDEEVFVLHLD